MEKRNLVILAAFAFEGKYYTRENENELADLPNEAINDRIDRGLIREIVDDGEVPAYESPEFAEARGTYECPICGEDSPHEHEQEEVDAYIESLNSDEVNDA